MSENKFTKGKWSAENNGVISARGGTGLRTIGTANTVFFTKEESAANAKLIAAAPDMYEALELMNEAFRVDQTQFNMQQAEAIVARDAAIKKATS